MEDVYDLSWSPDSLSLVSGSVDNTAMIWNVESGKSQVILNDHKGFVQGVAWDPANKYIATMCTDRYMRVFDVETKRIVSRSNKCLLPVPESCELYGKITRLYHDDTLQTFYRRLCFSPDSELLVTPSGMCDQESQNVATKPLNFSYIYTRQSLKQPIAVLPSPDYTVCIKFCPRIFQLRKFSEEENPPLIPLPYRMIFAVATKSSVFLYDTQQAVPFGVISNIHYTRLTDIAWSTDGRVLIVSSTDGFCSLVTFAEQELGEIYDDTEIKEKLKETSEKPKKTLKKKKKKKKAVGSNASGDGADQDKDQEMAIDIPKLPSAVLQDTEILSKIIKSDERFSPQKTPRPITPIAIRRHPRSVESPTPIAIRRQPRILIPSGVDELGSGPNTDEAVDAWPIGTEKPTGNAFASVSARPTESSPPLAAEISVEKMVCDGDRTTSDIRLVLDVDSQDEEMGEVEQAVEAKEQEAEESKASEEVKKTPRRVPLRTLSTPKSSKK